MAFHSSIIDHASYINTSGKHLACTQSKTDILVHKQMDSCHYDHIFLSIWKLPENYISANTKKALATNQIQIIFIFFRLACNQTKIRFVPNKSENGKYYLIVNGKSISLSVYNALKRQQNRGTLREEIFF